MTPELSENNNTYPLHIHTKHPQTLQSKP